MFNMLYIITVREIDVKKIFWIDGGPEVLYNVYNLLEKYDLKERKIMTAYTNPDRQQEIEAAVREAFFWLHRHPELSYEEVETTKYLRNALEQAGIRILDLPLKTGLVAEVGQGKPVTALRCDIDGLPIREQTDLPYRSEADGRMHACGHDFNMASVLGAALLLKQSEAQLHGTVRLIFQPAEEAPGGAKKVMETGALDDVSSIFGLHSSPLFDVGTIGIREGAVTASVDRFVITFRGKGTHAAHPQRGTDPIPLAAGFVQAAQTIVSRNLHPFHAGLVSITHVAAGNTWNIIPETALVEGTARSLTAEDRALIRSRIYELAEGMAAAHGGQAEIEWYAGPPATDNDPIWTQLARETAGRHPLRIVPAPDSLAGEDFAYYQEKIRGAFLIVGTGKSPANHNPGFRVDPAALLSTSVYLADLAGAALRRTEA